MIENDPLKTLSDIKTLMERSSKFLSLSGRSGILIGCIALLGISAAGWHLHDHGLLITQFFSISEYQMDEKLKQVEFFFIVDGILVALFSLLSAYLFTYQLTKKQGSMLWDASAKHLLINLFIPLIVGGFFCLILLKYQLIGLIVPSMLIFYGLSLLNASKYTYDDIRYLGIIEIGLGLISALYTEFGLFFWAFGFGVVHVLYGIIQYFKYER